MVNYTHMHDTHIDTHIHLTFSRSRFYILVQNETKKPTSCCQLQRKHKQKMKVRPFYTYSYLIEDGHRRYICHLTVVSRRVVVRFCLSNLFPTRALGDYLASSGLTQREFTAHSIFYLANKDSLSTDENTPNVS